ncbi:MAG: hypothetical protein K2X43_14250 [Hyphomonadaceae bacterium]|jgi:uncharacterized membrane protein YccC|nr:hypothetical protein [Hyphomonadaceae bacterium]
MKSTARSGLRRELMRAAADVGLVTGLIWLVSLTTSIQHGPTFVVLSLTVATMAALDLAFLRHLRRAYASPRRGVWRRD